MAELYRDGVRVLSVADGLDGGDEECTDDSDSFDELPSMLFTRQRWRHAAGIGAGVLHFALTMDIRGDIRAVSTPRVFDC